MSAITPEELDAMQQRCEAACASPWEIDPCSDASTIAIQDSSKEHICLRNWPDFDEDFYDSWDEWQAEHDKILPTMTFIANSRTDMPRLIAAVRQLQVERDALRDATKCAWDMVCEYMQGDNARCPPTHVVVEFVILAQAANAACQTGETT